MKSGFAPRVSSGSDVPCAPNPFCTRFHRPGAIPFHFSDPGQLSRLVRDVVQRQFSLIVGPHGSGKSTLIETLIPELKSEFAQVHHVRLAGKGQGREGRFGRRRSSLPEKYGPDQLVIIDGLEQLNSLRRMVLRSNAWLGGASVLATSHQSLFGFKTIFQTRPNRELVSLLARRLLLGRSQETIRIVQQYLSGCDLDNVSDVRSLWFELYDVVGQRDLS